MFVNMKTLRVLIITLVSMLTLSGMANADEQSNQDCKFVYRVGLESLINDIQSFQDKVITSQDLSLGITARNVAIKSKRSVCYFTEDPSNRDCVLKYKSLYDEVSDKLNAVALLVGNQSQIDLGFFQTIGLGVKTKIADLACGYSN